MAGSRREKNFWLARIVVCSDLGREVEEAGLDAAEERHRPFGEAGVLGEEAGVVDELEAGGEGELRGVVGDPGGAVGRGRG